MKKIIILIICSLILSTLPITERVSADTSSLTTSMNKDYNIELISESQNGIVYTFQEDHKEFKVVMTFNDDKTKFQNNVYEKNIDGKYEFARNSEVLNGNAKKATVTDKNGKTQTINLNGVDSPISIPNKIYSNSVGIKSFYSDLGPWTYHSTLFYRHDIKQMTVEVIITLIVGSVNSPAGIALTIYSYLRSTNADVFWVEELWHYKYIQGSNPPLPRAEWIITNFYADRGKRFRISGGHFRFNYASGYAP